MRIWQGENNDLMILPGSLPLYDGSARNELVYYLGPGWDPVIDRDIDGERAETTVLETKETRFGSVQAARRVARTVFLGSAPSSVTTKPGIRGLDRARVLLGCLQPGQASSLYSDALNRLADQLHYLNSSGDKAQEATRYWFDTRANLRREMEERKKRFEDGQVRGRMAEILKKLTSNAVFFDGMHIFTPHSDVPDDSSLRLIVLPPEQFYSREESRAAFDGVLDCVRNHGTTPRYRGNRLLFLAPDHGALARLRDCIRVALAWNSIVEDVAAMRLVLDNLQAQQAKKELVTAEDVLPRVARECYKWLLCPGQDNPTAAKPMVEVFALNTGGAALGPEIERVCIDNVLVITTWSPIHLRDELKKLYWKAEKSAIGGMAFWEDTLLLSTYTEEEVRFALLPKTEVTVTREGIQLGDCFYGAQEAMDYGWFVAAGHSRFSVQASYDLRLVDTIYIHDKGNPNLYFKAHLLDKCSHFRGLSHREVEALGFLKRQLNHQGEQLTRQLKADFHQSIAATVSYGTSEMEKATKGKSRSARKKDTKAAREDARRHERQESLRPPPAPIEPSATIIPMPTGRSDAPSVGPRPLNSAKSRQQKYMELLNGK